MAVKVLFFLFQPEPRRQVTIYPKSQVYRSHGEFTLEDIRAFKYFMRCKAKGEEADGNGMDITEVCNKTIVLGRGFLKDLTECL